ncbi:hypothetical protein QZH41_009121, partial [Actinostola sp. cb2023]
MKNVKAFPVAGFYVVFVSIDATYSNKATSNGCGSEVLQLGLATCPLFVILGMIWIEKKTQPSLVMGFVTLVSLIMTVIICSTDDLYFPFKYTVTSGVLGLLHGLMLAMLVLYLKEHLSTEEVPITQLLHSINLACVICLPFVMLLTGEIDHLLLAGLPGGWYNILSIAFIL